VHRRRVIGDVLSDLALLAKKPVDENARGVDVGRAFNMPISETAMGTGSGQW